jgi:hypothetical protein
MKRITPGVALLLIGPLLGELVSGHQSLLEFCNPIFFVVTALPYGCGALLCREFTRRWRKGWLSLLLLAITYALYEEGFVSRAFFDPKWSELGALADYNHYAGINWTYSIMLIHFHVTISMMSSILLAELLFPEQRHEPWLTNKQAALCGLVLALWMPVLALLASADEPLYVPSPGLWALTGLAMVGLVIAARLVPAQPLAWIRHPAPRPRRFMLLGAVNMWVIFITVFFLPEGDLLPPLIVSVIFLLAFDIVSLGLLLRWSGNWDDRHRLALVTGFLSFFLVFSALMDLEQFAAKSLVSLATAVILWKLGRRIAERTPATPSYDAA